MSQTPGQPTRIVASNPWVRTVTVGTILFVVTTFVIALGFDFDARETLEVLVTGALLVGVMGIAGGIPWVVGRVIDRLTDDGAP